MSFAGGWLGTLLKSSPERKMHARIACCRDRQCADKPTRTRESAIVDSLLPFTHGTEMKGVNRLDLV